MRRNDTENVNAKSVGIFVFSGTGNTMQVAGVLKKYFEYENAYVEIFNIDDYMDGAFPDITDFDMIGIGYPIHAFNAPWPVNKFIKSFPKSSKKVFIFKTSGEPFAVNHSSSHIMYKILKAKDYDLVFERHFLMPYNIIFKYPDPLVKQMLTINELLAKQMVGCLINGKYHNLKYNGISRISSLMFRNLLRYGAKLNGRFYTVDETNSNCDNCLRCIKNCPSKNITRVDGKNRFGWKCFLCMRCVSGCEYINMGLINFWAIHGNYDFNRIMMDDTIPSVFINHKTKGYFKGFLKYYNQAEKIIKSEQKDNLV